MILPRSRSFWSVGLGHFTNDLFMSSGVVLLTFLSGTVLPMSNTQIGFAVSMQQLTGAMSQPFFGLRADRSGGRWQGSGGVAWVVSMFLLALATALLTHNYYLMLIPFILQGLGSGAFHPVGTLQTAEADDRRIATNLSYFFFLGQMGLASGPALVGMLLDAANQHTLLTFVDQVGFPGKGIFNATVFPIFILGLFAIPGVFFMMTSIPARHLRAERNRGKETATSEAINWKRLAVPFLAIAVLVILRGMAQPGSVNFIPVLFEEKGWSPAQYGLITSSFWIGSSIAGLIFGMLADRYDRRWVVMFSMLISAPAFFLLPVADGALAVILAVIGGGFSGGSHSIIVALSQELVPNARGFASGTMLGFIFATGALGSLVIGMLSDAVGLATTFQIAAVLAACSGLVAFLLPKRKAAG
jgi:FSR family fosmidomycin resistance protein-like MFS transporter